MTAGTGSGQLLKQRDNHKILIASLNVSVSLDARLFHKGAQYTSFYTGKYIVFPYKYSYETCFLRFCNSYYSVSKVICGRCNTNDQLLCNISNNCFIPVGSV